MRPRKLRQGWLLARSEISRRMSILEKLRKRMPKFEECEEEREYDFDNYGQAPLDLEDEGEEDEDEGEEDEDEGEED